MRKKHTKRLLAGLLCVSLMFQSSSMTSLAAVQTDQELSLEDTQTVTPGQEISDDNSSVIQRETESQSDETSSVDNIGDGSLSETGSSNAEVMTEAIQEAAADSETEQSSGTKESEMQETSAENAETEEAATVENAESKEILEDAGTEGTTATETESSTTQESDSETDETDDGSEEVIPGEFQNVSVEFDGYHVIVKADYTSSSNADQTRFCLVTYDKDGEEVTSTQIYSLKDTENTYSIPENTMDIYGTVQSIKIKSIEENESGKTIGNIYSEEFTREQLPEIHFMAGEPEIGVGKLTVPFHFDGNMHRPAGKEDSSFAFTAQLKCGSDSIDEMSSGAYGWSFKGEDNETFSISISDLEAEKTFHAQLYIEIAGPDTELGNIYEQTIDLDDFTTPKDEAYNLVQEFPDEVFREKIKTKLSLDDSEMTVKESQLGTITYLYESRSDITTSAIKDIKGIELLSNIEYIELGGHELTDVSSIEWEKLTKLRYMDLRGNCIDSLPDLTKNAELNNFYISDNFISSAEILNRQDKLPESCSCWDYGQRQKEFKLITEENYYQTNGKSEVALRIQGYNGWFSHTFKTYIDDNLIETQSGSYTDNDGYNYCILYNQDIPYETGAHTLKFEMYEGSSEELTITEEVNFEIAGQRTFLMDRSDSSKRTDVYYMSAQEEYLSVYTYGAKKVTDIYLMKDGMIYGKNDWLNCDSGDTYINKYPHLGSYSSNDFYYRTSATIYINKQQLSAGTYDLKLLFSDNTEEILEGTIEVISSAIIKGVSAGGSYDHTGEYLYLALSADFLDPSRINYTIKDSTGNRTLQTEYIDCKPIYNGYVVKLKKTGWDKGITNIRVYFSGKEDYPLYVATSYNYCYIENMMYFSNYNYHSEMLEIGITSQSNIEDYTYSIVRTDLPWDFSTEHIQEEYTVRLEEIEDTIYNVIPIWEEEDCTLYGGYYRFAIKRSDDSEPYRTYDFYIPGLVIERAKRLTDNGYWGNDNYNLVQQGIGRASRSYYSEITYVEGNAEDFSAQITGDLLETPLDAQRIYTWNYSSDVYKTGIDMEFDYSVLELGEYTIELYYRNSLIAEYEIQVIPNDIFVLYDNCYASWNWDDTFYVDFYTPNCGESDDYTVLVTDINGNEIEGLTVTSSYKNTSYSYVNFNISGLKKSEADRYYYFKLLHKTKGEAYCNDLETKYYNNVYGKYTRIYNNSKYGWNSIYINGRHYGYTGIWQEDTTIFPATFTIYKFNGTESYYSKVLTEEDFDGRNFYFTQEIIDALPRKNGYYDLVLIGNEGQFLNDTGVQISLDTDVLNAFRVVPTSMTLKINVTEESSKTITAYNSTETPTFESDDTTIADVTVSEEDPNVATVEAVGVGRTSITVISGSNIKKVIVEVTEAPIDAEKIYFNDENIKAVQGTNISAFVIVEPEKAWISSSRISYTSSDETVVSVGDSTTRNITLTANNPGTATITAKLEGTALTTQCIVNVVAGYTEEEKAELISAVGSLYFLDGAEHTLADIVLPEGWRWSNPSQRPTADSNRPSKEFLAIYAKDGLDYFTTPLTVYVTGVNVRISGASELHLSEVDTYKMMYEFTGYKPGDNTTYAATFKWAVNENLIIQGKDDQGEVIVQAGTKPGRYALQGTLYLKNTKTGEERIDALSFTIAVKDNTDEINEAIMKKTYYYLSGADTSLKDIPIGDGWSWVQPDTVPQADDSIKVQNFLAQYTAEGRDTINARLSVAVAALDKVNILGAAKIAGERTGSYQLKYSYSGYDIGNPEGYDIRYQWKGSDGITVEGADNADSVMVRTGSTPGSYALTAEVTVTNRQTGNATKTEGIYQIQVLEKGAIDSIEIRPANQQPEKALACVVSNGALESEYAAFDRRNNFRIQLAADTMTDGAAKAVPVQWSSSDTKIADIDSNGLVTVKGSGITIISATATDSGAYSEEIALRIQDFTPVLENKSITVYQYSSAGTEIGLTANSSNKIRSISVNASGLKAEENAGVWYLKATGYNKKTVENVVLTISTDKGNYEKPLKVTVNVTQPKAALKQSVKPNIFYTDAQAVFKVTSKYMIERIEDASSASETCFHVKDYDVQAGLLTLEPYGVSENIESYKTKNSEALKAKVKVIFEGYTAPVEMTVKVNVQNKKPSLRIDTASFIKDTGMDEALTYVRNGKTIYHLDNVSVDSRTENVSASVSDGKLRLNYSGTSNTTYRVELRDKNWTQAVTVSGKLQMINADALALQAETTKITVNKANLSEVIIPVAIKGNSALEPNINIEYDSTVMEAAYQEGAVVVRVLESAPDKTYKVTVGGTLNAAGRSINVKKAVIKITVTSKEASVKLLASGKINIADRKYSATTYTPTLKNMDANIIGAEVTGELSEYFYAYLDETEKVVLKAVSGKPLKANQKYTIEITTSFDNGYQTTTKVNIKPVNKLPKVKASLSKGTLYKSGDNSRLSIRLTLDAKYSISKVQLDENQTSEYFALMYDASGLVVIALSEKGLKIPSGTYVVPYQIMIADADNEKPITQNVKITVK